MYVIRCVKSGAFSYNMFIQEGEFVNSLCKATKSLKHAITFDTKREIGWHRSEVTNKEKVFMFTKNENVLPARFEIVRVELTIKE